ncbi:MAG: mechanosensitive ion channel domain-containing protein [Elainellaceae cyanobacterium]
MNELIFIIQGAWRSLVTVIDSGHGDRHSALATRLRHTACHASRRWGRWLILAALSTLLVISAAPSHAQSSTESYTSKASVIVDGQEVFQIGGFGRLTARERADIVNQALQQEVESTEPVELRVVPEKQIAIIRSQATHTDLVTVTQDDLASNSNPYGQALMWRRQLEAALQQAQFERSLVYIRQAIGLSLAAIIGAIAIHLGLRTFGRVVIRRLSPWLSHPTSPLHPWEQSAKLLIKLAILGIQAGLWGAIAFYITDLFPHIRGWRNQLFSSLNAQVITLGSRSYSALSLLLMLASLVGLWFAVSGVTRLVKLYVLRGTGVERRVQDVISILTQYVLTFLGLIVLFQLWGIDVSSLAILASVLGVGIGFGVQNITNNLISGLIITLERPIQIGDFVQVGELVGVVEHIGARSTHVCTLDQVTILVPNSRFLENEVVNWSHGNPVSRLHIPVGVAYGSDVETVQRALLEAAKNHPEVLIKPPPEVWFQGFGDSSLDFDLLVWTGEPKKQFKVKSDLYYCIEASLRHYKIEIPFPQRDLHVRSPHLEQFVSAMGDYTAIRSQSSLPNGASPRINPANLSAGALVPESSLATVPRIYDGAESTDLEAIATDLRKPDGLDIQDRRYRGNLYPACFTGADLVEWLVQNRHVSRDEAIVIGQRLVDHHIIHHVLDDAPFQDGYVFYRFYHDDV